MGIPVVVTHALDGQQVEFTLDFSEGSLAETLAAIHAELEEGEAVRPVGEYVLISPSRGAYLTAETWLAGGARWLEAGNNTSPVTNATLQAHELHYAPSQLIKNLIRAWREEGAGAELVRQFNESRSD